MRTPDIEGVAIHDGPESCVGAREGDGEALTGVRAGQPLSREITVPGCRRRLTRRKATSPAALARAAWWTPRGLRTCACTESFCARTGRSHCSPVRLITGRAVQGTLRRYAWDERGWEVRWARSTSETGEQGRGGGCGVGGGKALSRGEHGQQNAPRTQRRARRAQCAGSCA